MNIAQLQTFISVMHSNSITKAAEQLHITQPAATKRIQTLETEFKSKLFDVVGKQMQPTAAAFALLPFAQRWLNDYEMASRSISQHSEYPSGILRIGTSHHIGLHHLSPLLKQFAKQYQLVELDVHFVDSEQAHQAVLQGELDLAFLTLPPHFDKRLKYITLWQDPLSVVVAPFHPLANILQQKQKLNLQDLLPYKAILPAQHTYTTQITLQAFKKHHLKPNATTSTNPLESIRMLVAIGLGWSVLPQTLINEELIALPLKQLHGLERQLGMVYNQERSQSKACLALLDAVTSHTVQNTSI